MATNQVLLGLAAAAVVAALVYFLIRKQRSARVGSGATPTAPYTGHKGSTAAVPSPKESLPNANATTYAGIDAGPGALDMDTVLHRGWMSGVLGDEAATEGTAYKPAEEQNDEESTSMAKAKDQILGGLRKAFAGENGSIKLDGSRIAKVQEAVMAVRDGMGARRRSRLTGLNNDPRTIAGNAPARPEINDLAKKLIWEVPAAFTDFTGVLTPQSADLPAAA